MRFDRSQTHVKLLRDLWVGATCRHEFRHAGLGGCQPVGGFRSP
jgi:hypothetical protein